MEDTHRRCEICNVLVENSLHKSSQLHRFNFLLFEWNQFRKTIVQNRNGVKIEQKIKGRDIDESHTTYNKDSGSFIIKFSSMEHTNLANGVQCAFTIENERRNDRICLLKVTLLHPHFDNAFNVSDPQNIFRNNRVMELAPKQKYEVTAQINLRLSAVGSYKIPLAFSIQVHRNDNAVECFTVAREIIVVISDYDHVEEDEGRSPFTNAVWKNVRTVKPPTVKTFRSNFYPISKMYFNIFMAGLMNNQYFDAKDHENLEYVRGVFDFEYSRTKDFKSKFPTSENYREFYHFLLWIDEIAEKLMLQRYNMSKVTMKVVHDNMLELEVPGLAEKRPSLLSGDLVRIRLHNDHTAYKGEISTINDKTIWIKNVDHELVFYLKESEDDVELDVAFELCRLPLERKHRGVDDCVDGGLLPTLFPDAHLQQRPVNQTIKLDNSRYFNQGIVNNREQQKAVLNILNGTSHHAPYIVFGPPGTGKTVTIVEAILQLKANFKSSKILICAPVNAACDMLTSKLIPFCTNNELIRIHTKNRHWGDVPNDIKPYSNHDGMEYTRISAQKLATYKIVIATLVLIGRYSGQYAPDYVFIDEAAQAMEPEADIAIGLLSRSKHLVLAGDPKQLGPLVSSRIATKLKLDISLLERLMTTNTLYKNGNSNFITMLKLNYRAHPEVLELPNELFYEKQLIPVNRKVLNDPIAKIFIYPKMLPYGKANNKSEGVAIEFYAVFAKEQRQGKSPSYFNESEIQTTVKCIRALLDLTQTRVCQSDIGVVTPYIRQVQRIKQRLQQLSLTGIEVGTTEVFQGREKRIIIVTTVRAQHSLLLFDKQYKLGFVSNEKRLNVALTRAMSKLIVVGNPFVLGTDPNWLRFIELCEEKGAYFGGKFTRRTRAVREEISQRLAGVKLNQRGH